LKSYFFSAKILNLAESMAKQETGRAPAQTFRVNAGPGAELPKGR